MNNLLAQVQSSSAIKNNALGGEVSKLGAGAGLAFYIGQLWKTIVILGGLAFIIYLIWGGITIMMAGADKGKVEEGQRKITNALIGLAVLVLSYAIVILVENVFQINLLQPEFPTTP